MPRGHKLNAQFHSNKAFLFHQLCDEAEGSKEREEDSMRDKEVAMIAVRTGLIETVRNVKRQIKRE